MREEARSGRHPGADMSHSEDQRRELFIFPDGTAIEMIVFAEAGDRQHASSPPERGCDAEGRETQPEAKPTATQAPPPTGRELQGAAHLCPLCGSDLVHPLDWERNSSSSWNLLLRCPECETERRVVLGREGVEAFNREIYLGTQVLAREADAMTRRNFSEESAKLVEALARDLILPMDF
jgi:hypothetical protein